MKDLSTRYLGLTLSNPLVASAGPLTGSLAGIAALADAGVGAVVLPSLFEEQLRGEADRDWELPARHPESGSRAQRYYRDPAGLGGPGGPDRYLKLITRAAETGIPVIGSLNGVSTGGWTDYASAMQAAGASAIELNVYYPAGAGRHPGDRADRRPGAPAAAGAAAAARLRPRQERRQARGRRRPSGGDRRPADQG